MARKYKIELPDAPSFLADNAFGVKLLDVYAINYYGFLVFFQVCELRSKSVYLIELGTKEIGGKIMLRKGMPASRNPLVITESNRFTTSNYEVTPEVFGGEVCLPIDVGMDTPLYKAVYRLQGHLRHIAYGKLYAKKVDDPYAKCWYAPDRSGKDASA